ncbi:MAG: hypothetical protein ABI599_00145 [Flavobacteriales bacterium]
MNLVLYVREDCHDCGKVIAHINANNSDVVVDDIDHPLDPNAPKLFAAPALCSDGELLAYGLDIIALLERIDRVR